ncbi:MAG: type II toxin-antitoxin system RelE/ParE family toxin [Magnetococcales bacterium]|nr:type II toxin-antitoxin system RelE/ParE family toxin [Magnetococcales bacterium]
MILQWTAQAWRDMNGCVDYIARDNPMAAIGVGDEMERQVALLANSPTMGRVGRVQDTRELVITGTPYIVVYRVYGDTVQVLRVLHGAQQWPSEPARLGKHSV